jgi:benzoyl-CoA-dihydrodiol lyase
VEGGRVIREEFDGGFAYPNVRVEFGERPGEVSVVVDAPCNHACFAPEPGPWRMRTHWWPLEVCRELDDALALLRDQPEIRTLYLRTEGDPLAVASADVAMLSGYEHDEFVREVVDAWRDMLVRLDAAAPSVVAVVEPGSCFVGILLELALAADRLTVHREAQVMVTGMNLGVLPRADGRTRLEARFADRAGHLAQRVGDPIPAQELSGTSR